MGTIENAGRMMELKDVIVIGIATSGRSGVVANLLDRLQMQTRLPDKVIFAVSTHSDLPIISNSQIPCELIVCDGGLTEKRNYILDKTQNCNLIIFLDDDFIPANDYIETMECAFNSNPTLVCATGTIRADGIKGIGYSYSEAMNILSVKNQRLSPKIIPVYNAYGCNMVFKSEIILRNNLRFDEDLPYYGWLEDVDFSRKISLYGLVAKVLHADGVHLGVKMGRQSGLRFGYSQIANPIHLAKKGTLSLPRAAWQIIKNISMNFLFSIWPEEYVDRRGRAKGNLKAAMDLVLRRLHPGRVRSYL